MPAEQSPQPTRRVVEAAEPTRRVVLTRPGDSSEWLLQLERAGLAAVAMPLIEIVPSPCEATVRAMWASLAPGAVVMFVSPNAVQAFFRQLPVRGTQPQRADWPAGVRAAATGPGTVAALQAAGVPPSQIVAPPATAAQFDSETLWALLQDEPWQGRPLWVVRGDGGRDWLAKAASAAGAVLGFLQVYSRRPAPWSPAQMALAQQCMAQSQSQSQPFSVHWHLTSSEAIDHLAQALPQARWETAAALATHPRIAARASQLGFGQVLSVRPGWQEIVAALGAPSH